MTLADLLAAHPPKAASAYTPEELATLRALWLVFNPDLAAVLAQEQAEHGDPRHRAAPLALTDGRFALCADLLTEIAPGGIFAAGFSSLPADRFGEVEVIDSQALHGLLPEPTE